MWTHILKRLHSEIVSPSLSSEGRPVDTIFALLVSATELGSDVQSMGNPYASSARNFIEQHENLRRIQARIEGPDGLEPEEWLYLSYAAGILDRLNSEWEELYESPLITREIQELGRVVLDLLQNISFENALRKLETQWDEADVPAGFDVAALLYTRACAVLGLYASPSLYERISERLSFDNPFVIVYLAACCLKLDAVSLRIDVSAWTDAQYSCLMLMDTFCFLPGVAWG